MDLQVRRFNRFVYKIVQKKLEQKIKNNKNTIKTYQKHPAYTTYVQDARTSLKNNTKRLEEIKKLKRTTKLYNKMKNLAFLNQIIVMDNRIIFETKKPDFVVKRRNKNYLLCFGRYHLILYKDSYWRAKRVKGSLDHGSHEHQHIEGTQICWTHNDKALEYIRNAVISGDLDVPMCFFWNLITRWDKGNSHTDLSTIIDEIGKEVK